MSMLNQAAVEALCSATYLENYLECMDALPEEMQRNITVLRELDAQCDDLLNEIEHQKETLKSENGMDPACRKKTLQFIQRNLIRCQELGDEKIQIVSLINDLVESRSRQLSQDLENLDPIGDKEPLIGEMMLSSSKQSKQQVKTPVQPTQPSTQSFVQEPHKQTIMQNRHTQPVHRTPAQQPVTPVTPAETKPSSGKRPRRQRQFDNREDEKKDDLRDAKPKKKKKRKVKKDSCAVEVPIDPDEPTYCLCDQVSYGEMIGCDNEECKIEWFHFNCVNLTQKPKGKWYCPNCRGETSKVPRKDLK